MSLTGSRAHHPLTASHKRKRGYAEGGHIMLDLFDFITGVRRSDRRSLASLRHSIAFELIMSTRMIQQSGG